MNRTLKIINCGLHSGFPLCCIVFYTFIWDRIYLDESDPRYKRSFTRLYQAVYRKMIGWRKITHLGNIPPDGQFVANGFGRVPCPFCIVFGKGSDLISCHCSETLNEDTD